VQSHQHCQPLEAVKELSAALRNIRHSQSSNRIHSALAIRFHFYESGYEWAETLWAVANVGMIGGALGLLALDVARPRPLAVSGATLSALGNLIRMSHRH
jgi:hypothetical protein